MYTIELDLDDSIHDQFMELLNKLPKDKYEFVSEKKSLNVFVDKTNKSPLENKINELLKIHNLLHFEFLSNPDRILFTKDAGTTRYKDDYKKLRTILKDNNINHNDIGMDVLFLEK